MEDCANKTKALEPCVIEPTEAAPWFSMTRFSPVTDEFYFDDDYLVVLSPFDVVWEAPVLARSRKTLEEHIQYMQEHQLEKVYVVAEDISFLRQCPSVRSVKIIPAYSAAAFDYAPIYDLPHLKELNCQTIYGYKDALKAEVDYSRFPSLERVYASGAKGHRNLESVKGLHSLYLGQGQPASKTLGGFDFSALTELHLCRSPIRTLDGIEGASCLRKLSLAHCRSLEDVTALASVGEALTSLEIESCGKIKDFSWLQRLPNLEHLVLLGSNSLPNVSFLERMPKLKSFRFTMNVLDGDLDLCRNVPYGYCKNRKHYNLKNEELPKGKEWEYHGRMECKH